MPFRMKYFVNVIFLLLISFTLNTCTKENFTEPPDPFEVQQLDPNPQVITLGEGNNALTLKTNQDNVSNVGQSTRVKGSLFVKNDKYGDIRISNGDFELTNNGLNKNTGEGLYFTGFKGSAIISLPEEGLLKNLTIPGLTAAPIGFKKGSEFDTENFAWPVNKDHYYFYYENLNPFPVNITNSSLENIKKIAIDPTDPFFFVSCDFNGTPLGDLSDVGVGISAQGLIPFNPLVSTDEMPMGDFAGNLYIAGNIPLDPYPASFTGETVLSFGESGGTDNSDKFFNGKDADFKLGLNGQVNFDHTSLDWMGIDVTLGQATMEYYMNGSGDTKLMFVGIRQDPPISVSDFINEIVGHDWDFLDYLAPYETKETFYGSIGTQLSDWMMGFKLDTKLNLPGGFTMDMGHTYFHLDPNQMKFSGEAAVAGFNRIGVDGEVHRNGNFKFTGYYKTHFSAHWHSVSFSYSMGMDVSLKNWDGVVTFSGRVKLHGDACVTILKVKVCAGFTIKASVSISSNGHYKVCFSIGIGKLGFDVCLNYPEQQQTGEEYHPEMRYTEIPLEMVPIENRFEVNQ